MTLQLCVSRCAHVGASATDLRAFVTTGPADDDTRPAPIEPPDFPDEDDWDEFEAEPPHDDVLFDFCEIDDAPAPERGDYWDDSLDHEWDCARKRERRMTKPE